MGVHSFDKLGAKMGVHSFFWQRVRAVRHTKNMGAINSLLPSMFKTYRAQTKLDLNPLICSGFLDTRSKLILIKEYVPK